MYQVIRWLGWMFFKFFFRLEVYGRHHIPKTGAVLLYANHRSNWDPPILAACIPRKVHYMAKEELFRNPLLAAVIRWFGAFPVKRGAADVGAIKQGLKLLRQGEVLIIFPEGHRSKTGKLGKAQPGAALLALKADATAVPVLLTGRYRPFGKVRVNILPPVNVRAMVGEQADTKSLADIAAQMMEPIQLAMLETSSTTGTTDSRA
ncbi:MAG: lysophospholipid acyltransferase family protein [Bacillota bacterium]|nr:1-acyl-sn-glycerol-3-phosphate acyltransferase [Bacillota bacterium]